MATNTTTPAKAPAIDATVKMLADNVGELTLKFSHGEELRMRTDGLAANIIMQATMHGLKQKLVDAAAISRNPDTGKAASVADKYAAVKEVYDRLLSGEWNKRRDGSGAASGGLLFRALVRMYDGKKSPDDIRAFLEAKTDAEKAALRKNSRVAAIIEEIRAESAKDDATTDADKLLADLDD